MKYPCSLIQDLLPLYHDGVCSEESNKIIEAHLSECSSCKDYYNSLCEADEIFAAPQNAELEMKKAASFRSIKRKIRKKQIFVVVLAFAIFAVVSFSIVGLLKKSEQVISYEDNISVSMVDDSLIGRLQGNQANYLKIKQVEIENNGRKTPICSSICREQSGTIFLQTMMYFPNMCYVLLIRVQNALTVCFTIQGIIQE